MRRPVDGETFTSVAADGSGFDVDRAGNVYVPADGGTTIHRVAASDGTTTTIGSGLTITGELQLDAAGDVYFVQDDTVVELPVGGGPVHSIAPSGTQFFVAPDGAVTTAARTDTADLAITTYPADGATPIVRERAYSNGASALTGDAAGDIYFDEFSYGASGAVSWQEYPAGSTTSVEVGPRVATDAGAVGADGDFTLLQSATWCAAPSEASGHCTPDLTVPERFTRHADGTTSTVSISGLSIAGSSTRTANVGAVASDGTLFVDIASGPTSGLYEVPAAGGAVTQIDPAQFSSLMVN